MHQTSNIKISNISCDITCNLPNFPMKIMAFFDDNVILDAYTTKSKFSISHDFKKDASHTFRINLSEKTDEHTTMSQSGDIIDSAQIWVGNITLGGTNLDSVFALNNKMFALNNKIIKYTHDYNGYSDKIVMDFDGIMAFNGDIELNFTTPIYKWLLTTR